LPTPLVPSVRQPPVVKAAQGRAGSGQPRGHAALFAVLLLLVLGVVGCAIMNRYVFLLKKDLSATPAKISIPYQDVWFPALDGVQLNGWLVPGARDAPLVLFFHGNAGNLSDNLEYLKLLHSCGFPIFIFDYRGYGKSEGEPLRESDLYQDARGALAYLEGQGWRHERMIFFGQSLGSAVALQMALETPPAGLVLESSFTSMQEIVKFVSPLAYYTVGWWGIDLPFDNLAKIGRVEVPLLLIHGDQDTVVPVAMTRALYARASGPKMLHIISGGGHCNVFTLDSSPYLAAWGSYLQAISVRIATGKGVRP
jgi:pimeloyl-ACP methyl ester carboxylesterase